MSNPEQTTPIIPGTAWHVHDKERPQPRVVTPGNLCTLPPVTPPSDATPLFDGSNLDAWENARDPGKPAGWKVNDNGTMSIVPKSGNIRTKAHFGDIQLHVEWSAPTEIEGNSQGRGNSGVFLMGLYEVQVLDCYDNPTYADGVTAALYGQRPPLVNACCKPGEWHIFDIIWQCPKYHAGSLVAPACITMLHNGIVVHHAYKLLGTTMNKRLPKTDPHPSVGPIVLQDHNNPVRFRNIWIRDLEPQMPGSV